ncbi:uncharacterized protein LOC135466038 [Liolophura sinensis]|uniref:uncharacterized protein LOC135466038 n=1 Tax=Liolophura sinensis TaxID=3198878 RepID=UPI00315913EE
MTGTVFIISDPPDVTVTYDSSSHTLTCTAEGIPNAYTFSLGEHRVGETLVRKLGTQTRGTSVTYTLPDTLTYADTGDYVCTVTNGIKSGQKGQFYVAPPTPAVFQNHSQTLVIGLGKTETISVPFYARPSSGSVQVKWEKTEESDALESHLEEAGPVRLVVYGQEVSLPGIVTTLTLTNVSPTNEGEYSVTVTCNINGVAKTSKTSFYVSVTEISGIYTLPNNWYPLSKNYHTLTHRAHPITHWVHPIAH